MPRAHGTLHVSIVPIPDLRKVFLRTLTFGRRPMAKLPKESMNRLPGQARRHPHLAGSIGGSTALGKEPFVVPMSELLTPEFVSRNTRFANADEMIRASGLRIESAGDFDALPNDEWNDFIRSESHYTSWKAMTRVASGEWMWRRLGYEGDT